MMKTKKKGYATKSGIGYLLVGTLAVIAILFCVVVLTGALAPMVLRMHVGDAPAMMTMPVFVYCIFADFILLEVMFLLLHPGAKKFLEQDENAIKENKGLSVRTIVCIVCGVLLLCSIITAPMICNVFTEQGVDTYAFVKTGSYAWKDIPLYELTFSQQDGLELYLYLAKDNKIPMFGAVNSLNTTFTEKYGSIYGFACHLKEMAVENEHNFKVVNPESIAYYFKDSVYWEYIEKLIR